MLDQQQAKALKRFWAISDRVILVTLQSKPMDTNIIQVYAPTCYNNTEDIEDFYETVEKAKKMCKSQENTIILGDVNAKVEAKPSKKLDLGLLKTMPKVKEDFVLEVNNRFQVLAEANTIDIVTECRKIAERTKMQPIIRIWNILTRKNETGRENPHRLFKDNNSTFRTIEQKIELSSKLRRRSHIDSIFWHAERLGTMMDSSSA
ncbi:hypothetical protein CAPTEDRAFT_187578 [Capitella teleta]|uniref:Endonuclease/exonuclease/phosphatase domain-containing protein n=1 Tax=Capitella teleta TaxID=283909 RepID=R7UDD9_CAPTE|nr:hypothetical protein CAPTEDRAFT_187578 [Capitella teleta]|eukprot:ELU04121.1 hypothetical protein CAPTEDRAFT_187578 [Capitella teleta]